MSDVKDCGALGDDKNEGAEGYCGGALRVDRKSWLAVPGTYGGAVGDERKSGAGSVGYKGGAVGTGCVTWSYCGGGSWLCGFGCIGGGTAGTGYAA